MHLKTTQSLSSSRSKEPKAWLTRSQLGLALVLALCSNIGVATAQSNTDTPTGFPSSDTLYWQLQGTVDTQHPANVYGVDLEDNESNGLIDRLKQQGKKVVCYISAGSFEQWRLDADLFDKAVDIGKPLGDWPGEYYLDIRSENVRNIMRTRIDRAVAANCDALEPDNTDAYQTSSGFALTPQDQIDYLTFLANYSHSKGLAIGLKNTVDLIRTANLVSLFDFTLNESCYAYDECDTLSAFVATDKAAFIAMYEVKSKTVRCIDAKSKRFHLAFYGSDYALDGKVYQTCD